MKDDKVLLESLKGCLKENGGYKDGVIHSSLYTFKGKKYPKIEIESGNYIIQAFIIMTTEERNLCIDQQQERGKDARFPFYKSYDQQNPFGIDVNPSCAIAVLDSIDKEKGKWHFYNANDLLSEYSQQTFINYKLALSRFNNRLGKKTFRKINLVLYSTLVISFLFFILSILSDNGLLWGAHIPFNNSVILFFIVIAFLVLIPILLPYIDSFSLPGISVGIKKKNS